MIGKEIRSILVNDPDLSAVVGTRVYSDLGSQTVRTQPYIVYRINDRVREHSQDPAAVDLYRIEFFIHTDSYAECQRVEGLLDGALDRYPIGTVINSYIMDGIHQEDSEDDPYDIDEDGSRTKRSEYNVRIKVYDLGMIYSLTEQDTNILWINGARVYERVLNYSENTDTGWTVISELPKTYTILYAVLIEGRDEGSTEVVVSNPDWREGDTYFEVNLSSQAQGWYLVVRYIKEVVT